MAGVISRARAGGVQGWLSVGIDVASSERELALAVEHGHVCSAGVHPNSAHEWDDVAEEAIDRMLLDPAVRAVGETGLDFYRDYATPKDQHRAFTAQIELATRHDKALVIHTRDSLDEALDVLEDCGPPERTIFHCWSGDEDRLRRALALGALISFAGNVSFPSAGNLRLAASLVPDDRLLIETDSPYLAPVPKRGRPNEPGYVVHVGHAVAAARSSTPEEIASLTTVNARRIFGLEAGAPR